MTASSERDSSSAVPAAVSERPPLCEKHHLEAKQWAYGQAFCRQCFEEAKQHAASVELDAMFARWRKR